MRRKILFIGLITLFYTWAVYSQDKCDHESIILGFLQKISSDKYFPNMDDYKTYFDNHSEIEVGLRDELIRNNPNINLSDDRNSKSLALELLLKHKSMKQLINLKNTKNRNWVILKHYAKGSATIVYEVGVECSQEVIKIQMINWKNKERCGIVDILDSTDKSILIKNTE
jgi:hypothetical protein